MMRRITNRGALPTTYPHEPSFTSQCKRSCCWTPYGHAPRDGCTCHRKETDE